MVRNVLAFAHSASDAVFGLPGILALGLLGAVAVGLTLGRTANLVQRSADERARDAGSPALSRSDDTAGLVRAPVGLSRAVLLKPALALEYGSDPLVANLYGRRLSRLAEGDRAVAKGQAVDAR